MIIKNKANINRLDKFIALYKKIIGDSKEISTSKIKKIKAIKKNCKENGSRDEVLGSNPHSNGLDFSRSLFDFFIIIITNIIKIGRINNKIYLIILMIIIIYTISRFFDWKSNIIIYII